MTFQKGESGNLAGRPRGIRDRRAIIAEELLEAEADAIVRTALDIAKKGDPWALRLCLERISPRLRQRPLEFELPPMRTAADAALAIAAVTQGVADGTLTASEAADLARMVQAFAYGLTAADMENRVVALEAAMTVHTERSTRALR
jgi:hypothetical protein